jgi:hypothetical protein
MAPVIGDTHIIDELDEKARVIIVQSIGTILELGKTKRNKTFSHFRSPS